MKNLNVVVEDHVIERAKVAAELAGMLLRKWVERAIMETAATESDEREAKIKIREGK